MQLRSVDPRHLAFNPANPRRSAANDHADQQMAESIRIVGILQPPIVKETPGGLEILYGERRTRGAIAVGLETIDVLVDDRSEGDQAMAAIVENVVRAPLSPVDQWRAIHQLEQRHWTTEAIAATLALPIRTIGKLKLLARIHPPMLEQLAKGDMPGERDLRLIANATLEEQAAIWKKHRPKKGERAPWWDISRALHRRSMLARDAKFDDEIAQAFGIVWSEDLFAPADEDSRYTTDVDTYLAAQREWIARNLGANGELLETQYGSSPKLPPKAQQVYGKESRTDRIGYYLNEHDGTVRTVRFRLPDAPRTKAKAGKKGTDTPVAETTTARPPITKAGIAMIGELRTTALHTALEQSPLDDHALIALLVLAFGANNVSVMQHDHAERFRNEGDRRSIAALLVQDGSVTLDPETLRSAARRMLASVLSCTVDASDSGLAARHAGVVAAADQFLPTMASEDFLKCLSKAALTAAAAENDVEPGARAKDTRAALLRAFEQRTFVHPAARFAPTEAELTAEAGRARIWTATGDHHTPTDGLTEDETIAVDADPDDDGDGQNQPLPTAA